MSYSATKRGKAASKAHREAERLREEAARRAAAARRRRNRLIAVAAAVAVLAVAAVVTVTQVRAADERARRTGPENMLSDGVLVYGDGESTAPVGLTTEANGPGTDPVPTGDTSMFGVVNVKVYADYTDPSAADFWAANGADLAERVVDGNVTVELHAIGESQAAVAAARVLACVADQVPDAALTAHGALLAAQADLAGAGAADLVAILAQAGVDDDGVASCVTSGRFADWVDGAIRRAADGAVDTVVGPVTASGVWVLNTPYEGAMDDADAFGAVLEEALAAVAIEEG